MRLSERFKGLATNNRRQQGVKGDDSWYAGYRRGRADAFDLAARMAADQEENATTNRS